MDISLIPAQYKGAKTGATSFEQSPTRHDALLLFEKAKQRLLDVNNWYKLCGEGAGFQLTDENGNELSSHEAKVGNLIRIELPAPPNPGAEGYDWVRVEEFEHSKDQLKDLEIFGFRVRPVRSPFQKDPEATHFYTSNATSTFLVIRVSSMVTAIERGRNEVPNSKAMAVLAKLRNLLVAAGAWLGLAKSQWSKLVKGVIKGPPRQ